MIKVSIKLTTLCIMTVSVITLSILILSINTNNGATTISIVTSVTIMTLIDDSYIIIVRRTIATLYNSQQNDIQCNNIKPFYYSVFITIMAPLLSV